MFTGLDSFFAAACSLTAVFLLGGFCLFERFPGGFSYDYSSDLLRPWDLEYALDERDDRAEREEAAP